MRVLSLPVSSLRSRQPRLRVMYFTCSDAKRPFRRGRILKGLHPNCRALQAGDCKRLQCQSELEGSHTVK
eukprot:173292-Amphidinium_carterae.1